jgi:GAF domain-containing protein
MDTNYSILAAQLKELAEIDRNAVSIMANASALLMQTMEQVNWAGFYLVKDGMLKVGPFQGRPACVLIGRGKGVCGTAWEKEQTLVVEDVHAFPGHIACDSASRSEIVIPIRSDGKIAAVLDIDSPVENRFSGEDRQGLEAFVRVMEEVIVWG